MIAYDQACTDAPIYLDGSLFYRCKFHRCVAGPAQTTIEPLYRVSAAGLIEAAFDQICGKRPASSPPMTITHPGHSTASRAITVSKMYLVALFVCFVWLASINKAAAQGRDTKQQPANTALSCDAFKKNPDGSWTATRAVTVKSGLWTVSVGADTTYAPKAINLNGVDFAEFLDTHCGK